MYPSIAPERALRGTGSEFRTRKPAGTSDGESGSPIVANSDSAVETPRTDPCHSGMTTDAASTTTPRAAQSFVRWMGRGRTTKAMASKWALSQGRPVRSQYSSRGSKEENRGGMIHTSARD